MMSESEIVSSTYSAKKKIDAVGDNVEEVTSVIVDVIIGFISPLAPLLEFFREIITLAAGKFVGSCFKKITKLLMDKVWPAIKHKFRPAIKNSESEFLDETLTQIWIAHQIRKIE